MINNLDEIKDRYLRESFNRRLGHLASDLMRVSGFLDNIKNRKVVTDMLEESKFFIEWAAPDAPSHIQELFSEMQSRLALWHRHLLIMKEDREEIEELAKSAKCWSAQLVQLSGLLAA
ncbi:MAG: hypothetical protein V1927_06830 [Candidatus Omnitrophota bacterium]